jgi:hypothetical protein
MVLTLAALLTACNGAGTVEVTQSALAHGDCQHEHDNPNPALFEPDARPFGVSMEDWSERWWRWVYAMPASVNPNLVATADCGMGQSGPLFFLPALFNAPGNTVTRSCTVPAHKSLGFQIVSLLNDYPCPDPTFQPAPGQTLFDFLQTGAVQGQAAFVGSLAGSIDDTPLTTLASYHFVSDDLFHFTADTSLQSIDSCITGKRQPAAAASYFIVIKGLAPGKHVISTSVTKPNGELGYGQTLTLDVVDRDGDGD